MFRLLICFSTNGLARIVGVWREAKRQVENNTLHSLGTGEASHDWGDVGRKQQLSCHFLVSETVFEFHKAFLQESGRMVDMVKLEDWLSGIPSKYTRKGYKNGIKKFEEFYQKPIESMLKLTDEECGKIFAYAHASPSIQEIVWFCSEKCREKYHSLHFQRDMKELELN